MAQWHMELRLFHVSSIVDVTLRVTSLQVILRGNVVLKSVHHAERDVYGSPGSGLFCRETVNADVPVRFTGLQNCGGEIGLVYGIRIVLGFEADCALVRVLLAVFAFLVQPHVDSPSFGR